MTNDGFSTQIIRQQLGHLRVESSALYIHTDTTAATEYAESGTITVVDPTRPDDEGEVTP
ncbi:hypothetical protein ACWCQZ_50055 [Streptomyces sp. NPDC002285]